ncbi:hypothetical protein E2C01_090978 [Portunus trituberculatus]|uniref:Uncharacterized protein n=1 Tax=Portunus trituberculatus TaxID=210409 RepID=A0A5B7JMT7_PORTR|nr:hypothetical protein [Portunus trituberculatus]
MTTELQKLGMLKLVDTKETATIQEAISWKETQITEYQMRSLNAHVSRLPLSGIRYFPELPPRVLKPTA